jgi:preprotein translocase subunit YajC
MLGTKLAIRNGKQITRRIKRISRTPKETKMKLKTVENIESIKKGDQLIINGAGLINEPFKAQIVKVSKDGTEIIFDKKMNRFFNLGMYLKGESWVKEVCILIN